MLWLSSSSPLSLSIFAGNVVRALTDGRKLVQLGSAPTSRADAGYVPGVTEPMLGLTQLSNYLTLKGSFSAVSKPNF